MIASRASRHRDAGAPGRLAPLIGRGALVLLATAAVATGWAVETRSEPPPERQRWSLGPSFEGLSLTRSQATAGSAFSFIYGDCKPPPGEGGCAPPLEVQNWSICQRHPLEIDRIPRRILRMRGVPVIDYGDALEVFTAGTDIVLFGDEARARRAVAALRPARGPAGLRRSLAAPRLPRWALRELVLVRTLRVRGDSRRALRRRLGISVSAIRMRERLAAALGERALRGVAPATARPADVIGDRRALAALQVTAGHRATPEQRRRADRHRERVRRC